MEPGIHSLDYEAYAKADGIRASALRLLSPPSTPAHFYAAQIAKTVELEDTEALTFGTWAHRLLLEPDTIEGAFYVKPEGMRFSTKEGKAWRDEHQDKPIVESDDVKSLIGIRDALWKHPTVRRLLKDAETERCLFAKDEHGTLRKARLDALTKGSAIPDLKTCERADEYSFSKSIDNYGYAHAAAFYLDICNMLGIEKNTFCFIAVEKRSPHCVAVWNMDPMAIEWARQCNERNLAIYRDCMARNEWPGYHDGIETISLPAYRMRELEQVA